MKTHLGVFSILVSYIFISIFWYILFNSIPWEINNDIYLVTALIAMSVIYFCQFHEHTFSRNFKDLLGQKPSIKHYKEILSIIIIFVFIGIGASALLIFIESTLYFNYSIQKWNLISAAVFDEIQWSNSWLVLYGITVIIVAPITEELIFRGLILNRLLTRYNPVVAILISALIFTFAHLNKSYISSFIHGVILSMVVIKYASLYYPMMIHGIYNAIVFVLQKYFGILFVADINQINTVSYWFPEFILLFTGLMMSVIYYKSIHKSFVRS